MRKLITIVVLVMVLFITLQADIFIREEREIVIVLGQEPERIIIDKWLGDNKATFYIKDGAVIMDFDIKKIFILTYSSDTYFEADLPIDFSKFMPDSRSRTMGEMVNNAPIIVTPNGKTKKIGNWNCKGYDVKINMMGIDMITTYWATTKLPFDWEKYAPMIEEYTKIQMPGSEESMKQLKKIKGFRIAAEFSMKGISFNIRVLEIIEKEAPPGTYTVPKHFTRINRLVMPRRL